MVGSVAETILMDYFLRVYINYMVYLTSIDVINDPNINKTILIMNNDGRYLYFTVF